MGGAFGLFLLLVFGPMLAWVGLWAVFLLAKKRQRARELAANADRVPPSHRP